MCRVEGRERMGCACERARAAVAPATSTSDGTRHAGNPTTPSPHRTPLTHWCIHVHTHISHMQKTPMACGRRRWWWRCGQWHRIARRRAEARQRACHAARHHGAPAAHHAEAVDLRVVLCQSPVAEEPQPQRASHEACSDRMGGRSDVKPGGTRDARARALCSRALHSHAVRAPMRMYTIVPEMIGVGNAIQRLWHAQRAGGGFVRPHATRRRRT